MSPDAQGEAWAAADEWYAIHVGAESAYRRVMAAAAVAAAQAAKAAEVAEAAEAAETSACMTAIAAEERARNASDDAYGASVSGCDATGDSDGGSPIYDRALDDDEYAAAAAYSAGWLERSRLADGRWPTRDDPDPDAPSAEVMGAYVWDKQFESDEAALAADVANGHLQDAKAAVEAAHADARCAADVARAAADALSLADAFRVAVASTYRALRMAGDEVQRRAERATERPVAEEGGS